MKSFGMLLNGVVWLTDVLTVVGPSKERPANWVHAYEKLSKTMQSELEKTVESVAKESH